MDCSWVSLVCYITCERLILEEAISHLLPCIIPSFTETDYLDTYSENPGNIYGASSIDKAMKNAYTQTHKFVMESMVSPRIGAPLCQDYQHVVEF